MSPGMDQATLVLEIRRRLGLTQEKFAAKLGVTFPTVNRWENGKARPSPLAAQKIKDILMTWARTQKISAGHLAAPATTRRTHAVRRNER